MAFRRFFSFGVYPAAGVLLFVLARWMERDHPGLVLIGLFLSGLLLWTLLEYGLHRFVFHWEPDSPKLRERIFNLHLTHHGDPRNPDTILVRPPFSLSLSAFLFAVVYLIFGSFSEAVGVLMGLWAGFLYYEFVHYRVHLGKSNRGLLRSQRRNHFHHHFVDSRYCFGVTSPLWDWLFRTHRRA